MNIGEIADWFIGTNILSYSCTVQLLYLHLHFSTEPNLIVAQHKNVMKFSM